MFAPGGTASPRCSGRPPGRSAAEAVLVAQVDLMTTPTKERLAAALAAADLRANRLAAGARPERALAPSSGAQRAADDRPSTPRRALSFSFGVGRAPAGHRRDAGAAAGAARPSWRASGAARRAGHRRVPGDRRHRPATCPKLLRAVFQRQPEVAHVYLGSKRHVMERIFNDENEPFWRSAKPMELGPIEAEPSRAFIATRFEATGKAHRPPRRSSALLELTGGHPYATQELCYFLWEQTRRRRRPQTQLVGARSRPFCAPRTLTSASSGRTLAGPEARSGGAGAGSRATRSPPTIATPRPAARDQRPEGALRAAGQREVVIGERGEYRIVEPFLAEWLNRPRAENAPEARSTR